MEGCCPDLPKWVALGAGGRNWLDRSPLVWVSSLLPPPLPLPAALLGSQESWLLPRPRVKVPSEHWAAQRWHGRPGPGPAPHCLASGLPLCLSHPPMWGSWSTRERSGGWGPRVGPGARYAVPNGGGGRGGERRRGY
uniref:Uncharacterized protein n=1 Tax=Myotis myotis TaxID=51298 RepID=A0A7J7ZX17_MYOMY|nr:hypothetical protein mMyoMyo1_009592 [Myotis myotis]